MNLKNVFNKAKELGRRMLGLETQPKVFKPHLLGVSQTALDPRDLDAVPLSRLSRKDKDLTLPAFKVKRKLGPAFFTRGMNPRTRHARVSGLTADERALAREHGWI